jgi:hypothetical protein
MPLHFMSSGSGDDEVVFTPIVKICNNKNYDEAVSQG